MQSPAAAIASFGSPEAAAAGNPSMKRVRAGEEDTPDLKRVQGAYVHRSDTNTDASMILGSKPSTGRPGELRVVESAVELSLVVESLKTDPLSNSLIFVHAPWATSQCTTFSPHNTVYNAAMSTFSAALPRNTTAEDVFVSGLRHFFKQLAATATGKPKLPVLQPYTVDMSRIPEAVDILAFVDGQFLPSVVLLQGGVVTKRVKCDWVRVPTLATPSGIVAPEHALHEALDSVSDGIELNAVLKLYNDAHDALAQQLAARVLAPFLHYYTQVHPVSGAEGIRRAATAAGSCPVVGYFGASWCPPCQRIVPQLRSMFSQYISHALLVKLDKDDPQNEAVYASCNVEKIPTFVVFDETTVAPGSAGGVAAKAQLQNSDYAAVRTFIERNTTTFSIDEDF